MWVGSATVSNARNYFVGKYDHTLILCLGAKDAIICMDALCARARLNIDCNSRLGVVGYQVVQRLEANEISSMTSNRRMVYIRSGEVQKLLCSDVQGAPNLFEMFPNQRAQQLSARMTTQLATLARSSILRSTIFGNKVKPR